MSFVMHTKAFETTIPLYIAATKKDMAYVLNRAMRNIGFKAAMETPKKDPGVIEAELRKDKIGLKMVTKKLTGKKGTSYTTAKGKVRTVRRVTRKQIALRTRQLINRRKKRTGFMRQGWVAAMIAAGIPVRGNIKNGIRDSKSTLGTGKQATPQKLTAYLGNAVYGRLNGPAKGKMSAVMRGALQRAEKAVAQDMTDYAMERMFKTARKFSAKK